MAHTRYRMIALAAALAAAAGCFDEPVPAYKTVPDGARVYLQDKALKDFASAAKGLDPAIVDYINLDRNAITNLDGVAAFTGLKWLRLNDNKLKTLPSLAPLTKLRRIYLRDNLLPEVPEALKDAPALTDIELSGNPITEIPAWLAGKRGLRNLSFNRCTRLQKLPDDLSAWKSLKSLQLGELRLDAAEMARIRKALPSVAVVF